MAGVSICPFMGDILNFENVHIDHYDMILMICLIFGFQITMKIICIQKLKKIMKLE